MGKNSLSANENSLHDYMDSSPKKFDRINVTQEKISTSITNATWNIHGCIENIVVFSFIAYTISIHDVAFIVNNSLKRKFTKSPHQNPLF